MFNTENVMHGYLKKLSTVFYRCLCTFVDVQLVAQTGYAHMFLRVERDDR